MLLGRSQRCPQRREGDGHFSRIQLLARGPCLGRPLARRVDEGCSRCLTEEGSLLFLAIPMGLLTGLILGALGGGGAILTVPVLVYALGQDPRTATTSSLLIVGLTSVLALVPHTRAGHVRYGEGLLFGILGTAGSFAGAVASAAAPAQVLLSGFAVLLLLVAVTMLRQPGHRRDTPQPSPSAAAVTWSPTQIARILATATVVGALTGFFGVGGGFLLVPALVLVVRYPMPVAIGTSLLIIAVNSATAFTARALAVTGPGILDWGLIGVFTAAAIAGSLLGGRISTRVDPTRLTRAFAVLLVLVAVYTAARSALTLL